MPLRMLRTPPRRHRGLPAALALLLLAAAAPPARAAPDGDGGAFEAALAAAARGDWADVRAFAARLPSPLAAYFHWRELFESEREFPFETIAGFLERHAGWPDGPRLRRLAEGRIGEDVPAARLLAFFERFPPLTARGRLEFAKALRAAGRTDEARREFARAFPELALDAEGLRYVEARFGDWIDRDLLAARVDRLLWQGRIGEARALLDRLDDGRRRLAEARIALRTSAPGVDGAIQRVPARLRHDPGLAFDRLQWRLAKGLRERALEILLDPPERLGEPARWWQVRETEIRRALADGDTRRAYALARRHGQSEGREFAEAEWLAGWLALRFAGRPKEALGRFEKLYAAVGTPISLARAAYWAGRAAEALGRAAEAERWYRRAAQHPTTFYGQLAADRIGLPPDFGSGRMRIAGLAGPPAAADGGFDPDDERLQVARALCRLDRDEHADDFFLAVADEVGEAGAPQLLAEVRACGRAHLYVVVAKRLAFRGVGDHLQTFPLLDPAYFADGDGSVDPALLVALARQESHFAFDVTSRAGARGLTQILPTTAREIAERAGLPFSMQRLQEDPYYQMALARAHLARLLGLYDGALELATAAYNAGTGRVAQWIRTFGDPREMSPDDRIDWIERLPFAETRNYVQRVIEGYRVYRQLLEGVSDGHPFLTTGGRALPFPAPVPRPRRGAT